MEGLRDGVRCDPGDEFHRARIAPQPPQEERTDPFVIVIVGKPPAPRTDERGDDTGESAQRGPNLSDVMKDGGCAFGGRRIGNRSIESPQYVERVTSVMTRQRRPQAELGGREDPSHIGNLRTRRWTRIEGPDEATNEMGGPGTHEPARG